MKTPQNIPQQAEIHAPFQRPFRAGKNRLQIGGLRARYSTGTPIYEMPSLFQ